MAAADTHLAAVAVDGRYLAGQRGWPGLVAGVLRLLMQAAGMHSH
ncbi:DUF2474 domain-containing protein [Pseudomonas putida]|nr:DUF2474 domain-containing protein [Pseudomonas putida]